MNRFLTLTGVLLLCVPLVGCTSDPREGLVDNTVRNLDSAASKVASIKSRIEEALKKTETGKTPDFKEAILEVDALKKIAKEMQELKMKSDALKDKTTEEERKELASKFQAPLNSAIERIAKYRKELSDTMAQHKDVLKEVQTKLAEAEGEFEAIARR
jgi:predicted ribosome quality control (RQC) complex YloA/Tae2 family protein